MKKSIISILTLVSILSFTSCGGITSNSIPTSIDTASTSVIDSINKLSDASYRIMVSSPNVGIVGDNVYHPDFFYDKNDSSGYLLKDDKVYQFNDNQGEILTGEALDSPLYGGDGIIPSIVDIDTSLLEDGTEVTSLKRMVVIPVLEMIGLGGENYTSVTDLTFSQTGDTIYDLDISLTVNETTYSLIVMEYDDSLDYVLDFIENGQLTTLDETLLYIKDLFFNDNYILRQYGEDPNVPYSYSFFTDEYYIQTFTKEYIDSNPLAQFSQKGYMEILCPDKTLNLTGEELIFDDIYMFDYYGSFDSAGQLGIYTRNNPSQPGHAQGAFTYRCTDITQVMNYPKYLKLFNRLQLFYEVDVGVEGGKAFETSSVDLVDDLLANYQLEGGFDSYGGIAKIQIIYLPEIDDGEERVIFRLLTPDGNYYDLDHTNFGSTTFLPFEELRSEIGI